VIDPWAGSYMMERLTDDLARQARALLQRIDEEGGVVEAIGTGWVAREIDLAAAATQAGIDSGRLVVVGQNRYRPTDAAAAPAESCRAVDGAAIRAAQARRLEHLRARRDNAAVRRALDRLEACARDGRANLLACTIDAVRVRATVGECTAALERVWPRHRTPPRWQADIYGLARQGDGGWDAACAAVARCAARLGRAPRVLIAKLGQDGHDRGAKAVASALTSAGFDVTMGALFQQPDEVAVQACAADVDLVGVSSLAGAHLELVRQLGDRLRAHGRPGLPMVVGGVVPETDRSALLACGVAQIFPAGTSIDGVIEGLLALI
jgi:methylmalonyl-CoA mutase